MDQKGIKYYFLGIGGIGMSSLAKYLFDKGFNVTCDVISNILEYDIANVVSQTMKDPKTELQEIVQSQTGEVPEYNVVSKTGEGHSTFFISEVMYLSSLVKV